MEDEWTICHLVVLVRSCFLFFPFGKQSFHLDLGIRWTECLIGPILLDLRPIYLKGYLNLSITVITPKANKPFSRSDDGNDWYFRKTELKLLNTWHISISENNV